MLGRCGRNRAIGGTDERPSRGNSGQHVDFGEPAQFSLERLTTADLVAEARRVTLEHGVGPGEIGVSGRQLAMGILEVRYVCNRHHEAVAERYGLHTEARRMASTTERQLELLRLARLDDLEVAGPRLGSPELGNDIQDRAIQQPLDGAPDDVGGTMVGRHHHGILDPSVGRADASQAHDPVGRCLEHRAQEIVQILPRLVEDDEPQRAVLGANRQHEALPQMHAHGVMGAMQRVERPPLGNGAIVGLAKEQPDLALPLAHLRAQHLDARGLEDGSTVIDIEIIAGADRLDHSQIGRVLGQPLGIEVGERRQRAAHAERAIACQEREHLRRASAFVDVIDMHFLEHLAGPHDLRGC
jgi:hypothetical protein